MKNYSPLSLSSQIVDLLKIEKGTEEFEKVFLCCLEHLCLETKIKDFHLKLQKYVSFSKLEVTPSKFRLSIAKRGYLLLNVRYYTVYVSLITIKDDSTFEYYGRQHSVDSDDSALIEKLLTSKIEKKTLRTLIRSKISRRSVAMYAPEALQETVDEFKLMLPEIRTHINRSINKYIRFVKKSFNITHDEFVSELLFSAIRAHYRSKPNNNEYEKQLNKIRASVHNATINIAKQYTSHKNGRLINEGQDAQGNNVFTLKVVSENQMSLASLSDSDMEVEYGSMFSSSLRLQMENEEEINYSVQQLITRYGVRSKQARLVRIFFYPDCYMFNKWLSKKKLMRSKTKTTRDFLDSKTRSESLELIADYLDTSVDSLVKRSLPSLAKALGVL